MSSTAKAIYNIFFILIFIMAIYLFSPIFEGVNDGGGGSYVDSSKHILVISESKHYLKKHIDISLIDEKIVSDTVSSFKELSKAIQFADSNTIYHDSTEYICGSQKTPRYLGDLNQHDIYTSNVSLATDASLLVFGFSGKMKKKGYSD